ncbi:MAG TPA: hypothetical protein VER03_12915 [Bryobacteraceae bacterium]|nr:hypothetical protein [Bryobacteraceae bacterium]
MKKLFTLAALLACAAIGVASAARPPAASNHAGRISSTTTGTLTEKEGKFFLTDDTSHTRYEVRGEGLQKYAGQKVSIGGQVVPGSTGSPDILIVSEVSRKAAAAPIGKAAAPGVKAGLSKAAIVTVAGAGTAATVGTLYAADVIGGSDTSMSRK